MFYKNNEIVNNLPSRLEIDGRVVFNPQWSHYESVGWNILPTELINIDKRFIKWIDGTPIKMSQEEIDEIINAPIPVPMSVPRYQFLGQLIKEVLEGDNIQLQQALSQAGTGSRLLKNLIIQSEEVDPSFKPIALNEIDEAVTFNRNHPFIGMMGPIFGYFTEEDQDNFFRRAIQFRFGDQV